MGAPAGCRVPGAGCRGPGAGCRVPGAGGRVPGAGFFSVPGAPHSSPRIRTSPSRAFNPRWRRDRRAASGVVVTLLILMVAVGALSMVMGIYVPIWGKDTEAAQMKRAQTQFLALKGNIDAQILSGKTSTYTTRLTIGDDGGPIFHLARAPGGLRLGPETGLYAIASSTDQNDTQGMAKGMLEYTSYNTYYVDQSYRYENGALIVVQAGRAVMKAAPHFDARRGADGNYTLGITLISLNGVAATREGSGDVQIESTLDIYDVTTYSGAEWIVGRNMTFNVSTKYPSVWADFFNATLQRPDTGLSPTDYNITVMVGAVSARFRDINRLDLGIAVLDVQLGM